MKATPVIETEEALQGLTRALEAAPEIGVDTESNSFYNYHERICLLQFSTPEDDYIVDPLAFQNLDLLAPIFASPTVQKIFHAAENDILLLKKHHGFKIVNVFDTLLAAQILGYREVGLGSLLDRVLSIQIDKGEQRSDWARRPLSPDQIAYAARDTHYLIPLRDKLTGELSARKRVGPAKEEFRRLAAKEPVERRPDPMAYLKVKGVRALAPDRRGVAQTLFEWREKTASELDRPPFRVLTNDALIELARLAPRTWENLGRIRGVTPRVISRFGDELLEGIRRGLQEGEKAPPKSERRKQRPRELWTDDMEARFQRLRDWRNRRAEALQVEPFIVASNRLLEQLAREAPDTIETLRTISDIGDWRIEDYGAEILDALREPRP